MDTTDYARTGRRWRRGAALLLVLLFSACDTAELLDVDLPGNVTAEDIEDPALAGTMRVSAIGDFEWAWDNYVDFAARHSDEYIHSSGNFTARRQMLRDIPPDPQNPFTTEQTVDMIRKYHASKNDDVVVMIIPDIESVNWGRGVGYEMNEFFPPEEAGVRVSTVLMATVFGMALGGWITGVIFDLTGSYQAAFLNGILWNLLNLVIAVRLLRRPGRPLEQARW